MKKNILFREVEKFKSFYGERKVILFGAGSVGKFIFAALKGYGVDVLYFIDSDESKQRGTYMDLEVRSPFDLMKENPDEIVIVLTLSASDAAENVLQGMGFLEGINYYTMGRIEQQKEFDIFDPFLGHSRMDDLEGFKKFGNDGADKKVLTLGGSTTDYSLSDIHSWPFFLQQECVIGGGYNGVEVINGGMGGYYSGQELLKLLRDGIPLNPDIVVSYSGINDAVGIALAEGHPLINKYLKNTLDNLPIKNKKIGYGYEKKNRESRIDNWISNMRMMHAICEEFGIKFYSFLQPFVWIGDYHMTEKEKEVFEYVNIYAGEVEKAMQFYSVIRDRIKDYPYIYDFTDIFSGMSGIYYDMCHCNEEGNRIIANKIYAIINKDLLN